MDLHLTSKVIIVTGGARGIGKSIVQALTDEGAIAVIVDKSEPAEEHTSSKQQKHFFQADLSSAEACKRIIEEVVEKFGQIDGIVNNAGNNDGVSLQNGSPDAFIKSMTTNAGHYYYMVHYALPSLKASHGSIVNIGSKTSVTGQGATSGYVAAKGAILALTREWAVELLPWSIRVNAVVPAEVATPLYDAWIHGFANPQEKLKQVTSKIPLENRLTRPEEIANTVIFLLSDRSSHTTGQWIFVDGGYTHLDRSLS